MHVFYFIINHNHVICVVSDYCVNLIYGDGVDFIDFKVKTALSIRSNNKVANH